MTETTKKTGVSRRTLLKSTAGLAALPPAQGPSPAFPM